MEVRARAPGKIILSGEHAVVHGAAAMAAVIDLYTYVSISFAPPTSSTEIDGGGFLVIELKDLELEFSWEIKRLKETLSTLPSLPSSPKPCSPDSHISIMRLVEEKNTSKGNVCLSNGLATFLYLFISIQGYKPAKVIVTSDLAMGAGLGSSASFCVSLSAALLALCDCMSLNREQHSWLKFQDSELELVNKWAFEGEKLLHGQPSGVDNTVITYGNMITYKMGKLEHLDATLALRMLITNTNVSRNTKTLVDGVSERAKRYPDAMSAIFNAADSITKELSNIIQSPSLDDMSIEKAEEKVKELMEMNQGLLQSMGVSHCSIETVIQTTLRYGLISKLTGAGGGGCVLTLLPRFFPQDVLDKIISELETCGFKCFIAAVGGRGLEVCFDGDTSQ